MNKSKLWILVKNEYQTDIRNKSFWLGTLLMPVIMFVFGGLIGFLAKDSDTLQTTSNPLMPDDLNGWQVAGMMVGIFLTMFIMIYGAQIFNKVKNEKCNRLMEVLATCVTGRTMMLAKILSVGLLGMTQMLIWALLLGAGVCVLMVVAGISLPADILLDPLLYLSFVFGMLFFLGGYVFYGSMFAAVGAMTDKNQENQEYMTILTFVLLASFYIGQFTVDNSGSAVSFWCSLIPFTSPTVAPIQAIGGGAPWWQTLLDLVVLYACAGLTLAFSGKLYTSTLLLKGKRLSPRDMLTFLKSK